MLVHFVSHSHNMGMSCVEGSPLEGFEKRRQRESMEAFQDRLEAKCVAQMIGLPRSSGLGCPELAAFCTKPPHAFGWVGHLCSMGFTRFVALGFRGAPPPPPPISRKKTNGWLGLLVYLLKPQTGGTLAKG